jgi:membrane protein YdbS with pleckstrin-like domain
VRYAIISPVIIVIWLIIGAVAAGQRGYFHQSDPDCGSLGSTIVTILVGPLNYIGVNPEIECPRLPEPSQ